MTNSVKLNLPYIDAAQAQKHVTHNEALRGLDVVVQLSVLDRNLTTPPASPTDGDRYIVAPAATGAWVGQDNKVAAWQDNAWAFHTPQEGWRCWVEDETALLIYQAGAWATFSSGGSGGASALTDLSDTPTAYIGAANQWLAVNATETATEFTNQVPLAGVNATPDATNRLAVASPATLLNHEGAGHQLKVNKATATDTASLLFQDAFTGHAEFGLMGDDQFRLKISPDGTTWLEAMRTDADANVTFPTNGAITLPVGTDAQRPTTPATGMMRFNSTSNAVERYDGTAWGALTGSGGGGGAITAMVVHDEKPNGTNGGTLTAGAWRTRDLNTVQYNNISGASLAANQITLPAGTYMVFAEIPGVAVKAHRGRIYDVTNNAVLILGSNSFGHDVVDAEYRSLCNGVFTLSGTTAIEAQQICQLTRIDYGFGWKTSAATTDPEKYTVVTIIKLA